MAQFTGIIAATVTPTTEDGSINLSIIPAYIDYLISNDVHGVFVNGTTGEWSSYSTSERKLIAESWLSHGRDKLKSIIIHCGALAITDSKDLAKHAGRNGADLISCISPSFIKPYDEQQLVTYLAEVASSAPNVPFLYYHVPSLTNVNLDMAKFLSLAHVQIPTFRGCKISSLDFNDVYTCMEFMEKDFVVYYGYDEQLLSALVIGIKGAIGNLYNFLGKQFNEIIEHFLRGDIKSARDKQVRISLDFLSLFKTYGDGVTKVIMSLISGIDMGPSRLPMKTCFSDNEIANITSYLTNKGYL